MKKLLNLTNHPSIKWSDQQKNTALQIYGEIHDMQFPNIPPDMDSASLNDLVKIYAQEILKNNYDAVHVSGEPTFVYRLVSSLKENGVLCVASTTERVVEKEQDKKISYFQFVQFREY